MTRPFRWGGAVALSPVMDRLLDWLQARLRLASRAAAFALCVVAWAAPCLGAVGALLLSRYLAGG